MLAASSLCAQGVKKPGEETLVIGNIPSVFGASRFDQAATEMPASVSVVTAEDIATYGWRTLADLLRSVRGLYVTNDRSNLYVGTRGYSRPGDQNSRLLLLIDGVRVNDNVRGAARVGMESLVDLSAVDRVEITRGPTSSLYGNNAFLGTINVVTLRGRAISGVRVESELGSFGTRGVTIGGGARTRRGFEFFGSAGLRDVDGATRYFPEFDSPETNSGRAVDRDAERQQRFFGKAEWGPLALQAAVTTREKVIPTATFGSAFNQRRELARDQARMLALRFAKSNLSGSLAFNTVDFDGEYPLATSTRTAWTNGSWLVGDVMYSRVVRKLDRITFGASHVNSVKQEQGSAFSDVPGAFRANSDASSGGIFGATEVHLTTNAILSTGLRYDYAAGVNGAWNPRAAFIYKLAHGSVVKALYGNAFRAPSNYERNLDADSRSQRPGYSLVPERITTYELLLEKVFAPQFKWTLSTYASRATALIDIANDPADSSLRASNIGTVSGRGIETQVDIDVGLLSGRASYVVQRVSDPVRDTRLTNSPQQVATLNLALPLRAERAKIGIESRAMSHRLTARGTVVGSYVVTNLILSSRGLLRTIDATAMVTNLLDANYSDPVGEEHRQAAIRQDGRGVRLLAAYRF